MNQDLRKLLTSEYPAEAWLDLMRWFGAEIARNECAPELAEFAQRLDRELCTRVQGVGYYNLITRSMLSGAVDELSKGTR